MASKSKVLGDLSRRARDWGTQITTAFAEMSSTRLFFGIEPLESRVLLSGDPFVFNSDEAFDLTLRLDGQGDAAVVQFIDSASVVVASQPLTATSEVQVVGSDQDDLLRIDVSIVDVLPVSYLGGLGVDVLLGSPAHRTWNVTGDNAGDLSNVTFAEIENLIGAAGNEDTFVFADGGRLSGVADGGDGGFDRMVLEGGSYASVVYTVTGPDSGTIERDGDVITYAGLEPITDNSDTVDRVFTATDDDDQIVVKNAPATGMMTIESDNGTFESVTFPNPTGSLTIEAEAGDDTFAVESVDPGFNVPLTVTDTDDIALGNVFAPVDFTVDADGTITVSGGSIVSTRIITGSDHAADPSTGDSGKIVFEAVDIIVEDNASIHAHADGGFASGDVEMKTEDIVDLEWTRFIPIPGFRLTQSSASVDIGDATIRGNNVLINAFASTAKLVNLNEDLAENTMDIAAEDINGDGLVDLVVANFGEPSRLYLNNGTDDPFNEVIPIEIGNPDFTTSVAVGDIDNDNDLDIIFGNTGPFEFAEGGSRNTLYLNNGTVNNPFDGVSPLFITNDSDFTEDIALADIDGDGFLDVVAGNDGLRDDATGDFNRLYINNQTADPFSGVTGVNITDDTHHTRAR